VDIAALLRELVEIESPTGDTGAFRERLARELEPLGFELRHDGESLRADRPGDGAPILLLAHLDTVWERGTLARMPWRVGDGRAYGPGVYDMKGGIAVLLAALARTASTRALRVVCTADEEIGSPEGRRALAAAADGAAAALVFEPPDADGHLKTSRKGIGRFRFHVTGRPAHSSTPGLGASAVEELARLVLRLHGLSDPGRGVTLNVGVVGGGTRENVVAARAFADLDVRVPTLADRDRLDAALRTLAPETPGTAISYEGSWTRPPLERSPGAALLFAAARRHGLELGLDLEETSSPGGSDGNLVGALGLPVLDGLGAPGGGAHAADEHVLLDALEPRAELLACILRDPGL
jgi:glutamate carboxypeptidase